MTPITKRLRITGRVQGVGFRHFIASTANELSVTGWVRNRRDGCVEAVISGPPDAVHALIERARHGPRHAMVAAFEVTDAQGGFERFDMLPTE